MPIYSELVRPDKRRIDKVVNRALLIDFIFYTTIACAGYFSTFNWTSDLVIDRPPLPSFDPDYFVIISAVAICLVLTATYPVNYSPGRNQFFLLFFKRTDISNKE